MYVADTNNFRVQYFTNGSLVGSTIPTNEIYASNGMALGIILGIGVDLRNIIYTSDYDNARVIEWAPSGGSGKQVAGTGVAGNATNQLYNPMGLYVDPTTSTLYIPNEGSHCVTKWFVGNSSGIVVAGTCGISGSDQTLLNNPKCVTLDKNGNMYVIDAVGGGRVMMFCPNSLIGIQIITRGFTNASGIAVDTNLNLYVSDSGSNRIMKYMLL